MKINDVRKKLAKHLETGVYVESYESPSQTGVDDCWMLYTNVGDFCCYVENHILALDTEDRFDCERID